MDKKMSFHSRRQQTCRFLSIHFDHVTSMSCTLSLLIVLAFVWLSPLHWLQHTHYSWRTWSVSPLTMPSNQHCSQQHLRLRGSGVTHFVSLWPSLRHNISVPLKLSAAFYFLWLSFFLEIALKLGSQTSWSYWICVYFSSQRKLICTVWKLFYCSLIAKTGWKC